MSLDETDRPVRELLRDVALLRRLWSPVHDQGAVEVEALPQHGSEGDELVDTPKLWKLAWHVPLADEGSAVAGLLQVLEEGAVLVVPQCEIVEGADVVMTTKKVSDAAFTMGKEIPVVLP
jgi:hypothetical protein